MLKCCHLGDAGKTLALRKDQNNTKCWGKVLEIELSSLTTQVVKWRLNKTKFVKQIVGGRAQDESQVSEFLAQSHSHAPQI